MTSKPSWAKRNHLDEAVELVGFSKLPSEREWDAINRNREWLLEYPDLIAQLPERNGDILRLKFGIEDGPIHTLGAIATVYELKLGTVWDIVNYSLGDLKRSNKPRIWRLNLVLSTILKSLFACGGRRGRDEIWIPASWCCS